MQSDPDFQLSAPILMQEPDSGRFLRKAIWLTLIVGCAFAYWAYVTELNEIAFVKGQVVPTQSIQIMQHAKGGQVEHLYVREGDRVQKGQLLLSFDGTAVRSELRQFRVQLKTLLQRLTFVEEEFRIRQELVRRRLNSKLDFLSLQERRKELKGRIRETRVIIERLEDEEKLLSIYSPVAGKIHVLNLTPLQGVVRAGEVIMEIVPVVRELQAEVQIEPRAIGHIRVGQEVLIKFTSYEYNRFGGVRGRLESISPTTLLDTRGQPYFKGMVSLSQGYVGIDPAKYPILPGMVLDAEIKTGSKTVLSYLLKPIQDSSRAALTEK